MEKLLTLEEPQEYLIRRPYELVDPTPYLYTDNEGKGHSTKRGVHHSNAHTKARKAKRRMSRNHFKKGQ